MPARLVSCVPMPFLCGQPLASTLAFCAGVNAGPYAGLDAGVDAGVTFVRDGFSGEACARGRGDGGTNGWGGQLSAVSGQPERADSDWLLAIGQNEQRVGIPHFRCWWQIADNGGIHKSHPWQTAKGESRIVHSLLANRQSLTANRLFWLIPDR